MRIVGYPPPGTGWTNGDLTAAHHQGWFLSFARNQIERSGVYNNKIGPSPFETNEEAMQHVQDNAMTDELCAKALRILVTARLTA